MRRHLARLASLLLAPALAALSANAQTAERSDMIDGIHVHRSVDSPAAARMTQLAIETGKGACAAAKQACNQMASAGVPPSNARGQRACAEATGRFTISGDTDRVRRIDLHEYFAPARQWAVEKRTNARLHQHSVCAAEIVDEESVVIRHYSARGVTTYRRVTDRTGEHSWRRQNQPSLPHMAALPLFFEIDPLTNPANVSGPLGQETHGRHTCEVRKISTAQQVFTSCQAKTGTWFPGSVLLSGSWVANGPNGREVQAVDRLVSYAERIALPVGLFHPPASEPVTQTDSPQPSADNATSRWCLAEAAKTGINPCEDDDGDDDD